MIAALALAALLSGEGYQAGVASITLPDLTATALAIEDQREQRAVIVATDLSGMPRAIADPVAARLGKAYGLDRAFILLHASGTHERRYSPQLIDDLAAVVGAAIANLTPARLWYGATGLEVTGADGRLRAVLASDDRNSISLRLSGAVQKMHPVRGPLRAAFQVADLDSGRRLRAGEPVRPFPFPVQAMAFGKDLTVLALGGDVPVDYALRVKQEYGSKGLVVAVNSNDVISDLPRGMEDRIFTTIHQVMARVGRKSR